MKKYKVGYTQGTFDLFHVGHLNLLRECSKLCDYIIIGVNSDELVQGYKNKTPIIKDEDRAKIISHLDFVDKVIIAESLNKINVALKYDVDAIFIGDDWKNSERWNKDEIELGRINVEVVYLPYTKGISTTEIIGKIKGDLI